MDKRIGLCMEKEFSKSFVDKLEILDLKLNDNQINQFYEYYKVLIEWNTVMNLTAITKMEDVIVKHFVDSLSIVKSKKVWKAKKAIDVGTGAGFPGIPIKIAFPELHVTLLDSLSKRIKFLEEVIAKLEIKDIVAIHGRAEDLGRDKRHREQYDYCVSRAVANLSSLSEYCLPFVKVGGSFFSYKSGEIKEELENSETAVKKLSGSISHTISFVLPLTDMERTIIVIDKEKPINKKYPRKAGTPSKEPLH